MSLTPQRESKTGLIAFEHLVLLMLAVVVRIVEDEITPDALGGLSYVRDPERHRESVVEATQQIL